MTNHEKNYENIRSWLCVLTEPCEIDFIGRRWRVDCNGVEQLSGRPAHVNCKSVLIWYFTFGGTGDPSFEFTSIHSFSHGIFRSSGWRTETSPTLDEFRKTAQHLGAILLRKERYGEAWLLNVLPKIPVLLTYSEADDEFPASLDIKFGSNATTFLPFETLAVLQGLIVSEFDNTYY
jgi:hypothetical protein